MLGVSDQNSSDEDQEAAHCNLQGGLEDWRIHIFVADPGDDRELDDHDGHSQDQSRVELWNKKRNGVAKPAHRRHHAACKPADQRMAAARKLAIVG